MKKINIFYAIATMGFALLSCQKTEKSTAGIEPVKVELKKESTGYQLYCNGKPYFIKGAGFEGKDPSSVSKHGGNTIRTWRTGDQFITGKEILDKAYENGLMVCLGLEIGRERHGFDYDDSVAVLKQKEYVKSEVLKYKNHPALLAWGIGNELNLLHTNPKVWDAVNDISLMIKELDQNHPTTTMLAGAGKEVVNMVMQRCKSLDFLSFQLYGDIVNLPRYISESGYDGAYVVSEWGATGHWEVAQTEWKRPIEQNSQEKALAYKERYEKVIASDVFHCLGSFVFLWGQKQERTPTWYGMFLESGQSTPSVDVMQYLWTGSWPQNRAPMVENMLIGSKNAFNNVYMSAGEMFTATINASDFENDMLKFKWEILAEVPVNAQSDGGDFEQRPKTVFSMESTGNKADIKAPEISGDYRLFVYVFDGNNNAATANIPFYVK